MSPAGRLLHIPPSGSYFHRTAQNNGPSKRSQSYWKVVKDSHGLEASQLDITRAYGGMPTFYFNSDAAMYHRPTFIPCTCFIYIYTNEKWEIGGDNRKGPQHAHMMPIMMHTPLRCKLFLCQCGHHVSMSWALPIISLICPLFSALLSIHWHVVGI